MKIAVACEGINISEHFGHCEGFTVYQMAEGKVVEKEFVQNPGHRPGYLPMFLHELDVDVVIAGGMGGTAQQLFAENGIEVVVGAKGTCDQAVEQYAKGELKSTGSVCKEHMHEGHCHE